MTTRKRTMSRPVGGLVRLTPRYSGRNSHEFWRRINAMKGKDWDAAYSMGVALQNHEHTVLQFINAKKPNRALGEKTKVTPSELKAVAEKHADARQKK